MYDDGTDFDADISDEQHGIDVPVVANGEHPDLYSLFLLFLLLEKLPFFITFLSLFSMLSFCCSVFWGHENPKDARIVIETAKVSPEFVHIGIRQVILRRIIGENIDELAKIVLQINVDGNPIFNCSTLCFGLY